MKCELCFNDMSQDPLNTPTTDDSDKEEIDTDDSEEETFPQKSLYMYVLESLGKKIDALATTGGKLQQYLEKKSYSTTNEGGEEKKSYSTSDVEETKYSSPENKLDDHNRRVDATKNRVFSS